MGPILIYASVFIASLIFFDAVIRFISSYAARKKYVNYRLKLLAGNENRRAVYESMVRERALDYDKPDSFHSWFRRVYIQSGIKFDATRFLLYAFAFVVFGWLALGLLISGPLIRLILVLCAGVGLTAFIFLHVRTRRMNAFGSQLPDAIDVMTRSLSSGHPMPTSIALVSREMADPLGTEFGMLSDELTYGTDIDTGMRNMVQRVDTEDLKLLAISVSVQKGTGGNLVEILANLADVIRHRAIIKAKIKALSAEGRWTSWIMLGFPFVLYLLINTLAPTYFDPVWESGYGDIVLMVASVIMITGMIILRKIVNFDF